MRLHFVTPLMLLVVLGAGCGTEQTERAEQAERSPEAGGSSVATEQRAETAPTNAAGGIYAVDAANSEVFWLISKAGVMARFGHNHVISAERFSGTVTVDENDPARSRFELEIPVADLVVDDPVLRQRLGEEFASVPSEEDKTGTRGNMLGEALLDADMYPVVRVRGGAPQNMATATAAGSTVPIEIEILGRSFDFDVPGTVAFDDGALEARGEFALDHADLGLTPFSALGGALQVGPTIEFSYRIRAAQTR